MRVILPLVIVAVLATPISAQVVIQARAVRHSRYEEHGTCSPSRVRVLRPRPEIVRHIPPPLQSWEIAAAQQQRAELRQEMHERAEEARRELGR